MTTPLATKVLIIDDKEKLCRILAQDFEQAGCFADYALNSLEALKSLQINFPDTVLLDLRLGEENGLDVLKVIKELYPQLPVIMVTGYGTIENAVEAVKLGAWDYIQKPASFTKIHRTVTNAAMNFRLKNENTQLKKKIHKDRPALLTNNPSLLNQLSQLQKLAEHDFPILITGESGTGKELIAEYIHNHSPRSGKELFKINCAALAGNLLDNELFGHEKGAYTGANQLYKGIFEQADSSSLFLDELGDMSLEIQAKILRTLQNREIRRLGGGSTIKVNVRFIAATNKDISSMVENKTFREDLFYRLNLAVINIPPLRERKEDISLLAEEFLRELSSRWQTQPSRLSNEVLSVFENYDWPGNIRELKNIIQYMAALSNGSELTVKELPPRFQSREQKTEDPPDSNPREELEKQMILESLQSCKYNKKQTAEKLKMSRKTLYNKLAKYGIET